MVIGFLTSSDTNESISMKLKITKIHVCIVIITTYYNYYIGVEKTITEITRDQTSLYHGQQKTNFFTNNK
jgi:hypothetical protein